MAVMNRPEIGKVTCFTQGCEEIASVHKPERGTRQEYLYTRCPECNCNQSTGKLFQKYLKENTDFIPAFEHLRLVKIENVQPEKARIVEVEAANDEVNTPEYDHDTETDEPQAVHGVGGLLLGLFAVVAIAVGVSR